MAAGPRPDPLGELTADPLAGFKGRGGKEGKGRKRKWKEGRGGKRKRRGEERERDLAPRKKFWRRHCDDDDYTDSITNTKI